MPKRKSVKRVDTPEVQEPDGYIVLKSLTFEENQEFSGRIKALQAELGIDPTNAEQMGNQVASGDDRMLTLINERIAACITGWNWVDDEGNDLPLPGNDLSVFERLTGEEYRLLITLIADRDSGAVEARKKK